MGEEILMGFEYPWFLLLLLVYIPIRKNRLKELPIPFAPLGWSHPDSGKKEEFSFTVRLVFMSEFVLFFLLVLGLSSPYIETDRESVKLEGIDLVISMDLSASMQAADFKPNRLEAMKELVSEYLQEGRGNRTALSVFSGMVFLHYPFTRDKYSLQRAIESIHFQTINHNTAGGTAIGDALLFSVDLLDSVKIEDRKQALVLITDGENTEGVDPIVAAKACLEKGIHLYIIGLAGSNPVPVFVRGNPYLGADGNQVITSLEDASLKLIAEEGGGVYYRATQGESLRSILKEINELEKHPLELNQVREKYSFSYILSFSALILFLIYYWGGGTWVRRPIR
jgi:Ca-activated chloride channel homolog